MHDGDTRRAERALQPVFDLPRDESERFDPWWMYFGGQSRFADGFLKGLYDRVRAGH